MRIAKSNADQPVYSTSDFPQRAFGWSPLESWRTGNSCISGRPGRSCTTSPPIRERRRTWRRVPKPRWRPSRAQLDAFDRRFSAPGNAAGGPELTSSEMQKLASLGYVGLQKSPAACQRRYAESIQKTGSQSQTRFWLRARYWIKESRTKLWPRCNRLWPRRPRCIWRNT